MSIGSLRTYILTAYYRLNVYLVLIVMLVNRLLPGKPSHAFPVP